MPTSGTLTNLTVKLNKAPDNGAGTQQEVFTIYKNGLPTSLTCTIAESATTGSDGVNSVAFTAFDTITLEVVPSGTPATNINVRWSAKLGENAQLIV